MSKEKAFGYHLTMDLYGCDPKKMSSLDVSYNYLNTLPDIMKVHRQSPPFVVVTDAKRFPDKAGISGWIPIVESGCSVHTLVPTRFITIDVYSCKKFDQKKIKEFTKKTFSPKKIEDKFFLRGENYGSIK